MSIPVLRTKLHIPTPRSDWIPRPHLVDQLNAGILLDHRLSLISAPPGFGKSALLSEWVAANKRGAAWLSLDMADNDPARFLTYVINALQTVNEAIGHRELRLLQSPVPPGIEALLTSLINQISDLPDELLFILDDYHLLTAQPVHGILVLLLDHLPGNLHLAIATRSEPPLPLARLRGRGQLTELRQADLRFSACEVAAFLKPIAGFDLTDAEMKVVAERTEGWIAGLQMVAVSLRDHADKVVFIEALASSNRYIMDYLLEEVLLHSQSHDMQRFLLLTAILTRLNGQLCDALVGISELPQTPLENETSTRAECSSSQTVLEYLEAANLFIVPLDNDRQWYRYHHLFADLLRQRLERAYPQELPQLHRRAARWYASNGMMADAIEHALVVDDFAYAADLIEKATKEIWKRGEITTYLKWVERLPDEVEQSHPHLGVYHAVAQLMSGQAFGEVQKRLQAAIDKDAAGDAVSEISMFQGLIEALRGNASAGIEMAERALLVTPEGNTFLRSVVSLILGISYYLKGEIAASTSALEKAVDLSRRAGSCMISVVAHCNLAEICVVEGDLREAEKHYLAALTSATDEAGHRWPVAGMALIGLGDLYREWGYLDSAMSYLHEGIEIISAWGEFGAIEGYVVMARVRQARGDAEKAIEALTHAREIAARFDISEIDDRLVDVQQMRLWIALGNLDEVERWCERLGINTARATEDLLSTHSGSVSYMILENQYLALARLHLAQGRAGETLCLLEALRRSSDRWQRTGRQIEFSVLQALAYQDLGDVSAAVAALEQAMHLATPAGYISVFVDEVPLIIPLLQEAQRRGVQADHLSKLFASAAIPEVESSPTSGAYFAMVEALSEREVEVLGLIAEGLSNREIAGKLYIALSTVKTHVNHIFRKLDVVNRTQAVMRAQQLHLI